MYKGGGRVSQFLMKGKEVAWYLYFKFWQGEGGGVKNPENLADVIRTWPLSIGKNGTKPYHNTNEGRICNHYLKKVVVTLSFDDYQEVNEDEGKSCPQFHVANTTAETKSSWGHTPYSPFRWNAIPLGASVKGMGFKAVCAYYYVKLIMSE